MLVVYAVWHPRCETAAGLARAMFAALCANPDVPLSRGLGLRVLFRTSMSADELPAPVPFGVAQQTVVFVFADDFLVAASAWRSYVDGLVELAGPDDWVVPLALTASGNLPPGLGELQAVQLGGLPMALQKATLLNDVMHDICRRLDPDARKVRVFLSHARHDGLEITKAVRRYLRDVARLDDFFDATDIPHGTRFPQFLTEGAAGTPALLAVHTDAYASREWCQLELLVAKRHHVPIVVLSAVEGREARSFPYMGNVPVVRWHGETSLPDVVGALLTEVLRDRYFPRRVERICAYHDISSERHVFAYPPELLTVLAHKAEISSARETGGKYLYPDPPLGTAELQLLHEFAPDIEIITPTSLRAL